MDKKINYQARRSTAMARQLSYSKYEQELRPELRQNMNIAESTEDVKKFFVYTIQKLFGRVLERKGASTSSWRTLILQLFGEIQTWPTS
jgi:hypothetical protein